MMTNLKIVLTKLFNPIDNVTTMPLSWYILRKEQQSPAAWSIAMVQRRKK